MFGAHLHEFCSQIQELKKNNPKKKTFLATDLVVIPNPHPPHPCPSHILNLLPNHYLILVQLFNPIQQSC
jgi:hypothetical protein